MTIENLPAGRRVAVLLAGHATEYIRKAHGGIFYMFKGLLSDPGDTWDMFPVIDEVFPSEEEMHKYDCFIVTGSRHDAHSDEEWILKLCELIRKVHKQRRKLLGICFGHQVISRALGGKTGRAVVGWEVGLKKVTIADALVSKPYGFKLPSTISIIEIHQDHVWELPPGGELLASSEKTSIEIFAVGDHVLGIQGHPEYTDDITMDILDICFNKNIMSGDVVDQARASLKGGKPDREVLQQLCKSFLKGSTSEMNRCYFEPVQGG